MERHLKSIKRKKLERELEEGYLAMQPLAIGSTRNLNPWMLSKFDDRR